MQETLLGGSRLDAGFTVLRFCVQRQAAACSIVAAGMFLNSVGEACCRPSGLDRGTGIRAMRKCRDVSIVL